MESSTYLPRLDRWHRFVDGKTTVQRLLLALGASAGALLAIGAATTAVLRIVDQRPHHDFSAAAGVQRIENQSARADEFVRFLLAHDGARPLQLDHQVIAPRGPSDVSLQYNCDSPAGCNIVRVGAPDSIPADIAGGFWLQGCYRVTKKGPGYGAQPLDISLHWQGDTCPT